MLSNGANILLPREAQDVLALRVQTVTVKQGSNLYYVLFLWTFYYWRILHPEHLRLSNHATLPTKSSSSLQIAKTDNVYSVVIIKTPVYYRVMYFKMNMR